MQRQLSSLVLCSVALLLMLGCQSGGNSPVNPALTQGQTIQGPAGPAVNETPYKALLGLWDVTYDTQTNSLTVTPVRSAAFKANVTGFMNGGPNLLLENIDTSTFMTDGKLNVKVGLKHPFSGLYEFSGFDVWGMFLHDGSATLDYGGLKYAAPGTDGILLNADGYTRWWNSAEFLTPGVLGYTPGAAGTTGFKPAALLNPYKVFADGLLEGDDYATFLKGEDAVINRGVFKAGETNWRNYNLVFPLVGGIPVLKFQYAVSASWEGPTKQGGIFSIDAGGDTWDYPDSAVSEEAICLSVVDNSSLFKTADDAGGKITFDLEVFDWGAMSDGMAAELGGLTIESPLLTSPIAYDGSALAAMAQPGGSTFSSVYSFDLTCNPPTDNKNVEVWLVAESAVGTYAENFPGMSAPTDPLASFYRMWVPVPAFADIPPTVEGVNGIQPPCGTSVVDYSVEVTGAFTGCMWSVVPTGNAKDFSIAGTDVLSFDFATVAAGASYDIDCRVYNNALYTQATTFVANVPLNNAPVVVSGVDGPDTALTSNTFTYSVFAKDVSPDVNTILTDSFGAGSAANWVLTPNWIVYGGQLSANGLGTTYALGDNNATRIDIPIPADATEIFVEYKQHITLDDATGKCSYDVAWFKVNKDGADFVPASDFGAVDTPDPQCGDAGYYGSHPEVVSTWDLKGLQGSMLGIQYYLQSDGTANTGDWEIDNLKIYYNTPCGTLTFMWSVVPTGNPPSYTIPGGLLHDINWNDFGEGTWDVQCQVSDGFLTADSAIKTVYVVSSNCTNGMVLPLGSGTHTRPASPRLDLAFMYGGSNEGSALINNDWYVSGSAFANNQDSWYLFDADTTGAKTANFFMNVNYSDYGYAGSALKWAVDEKTHIYMVCCDANLACNAIVTDQSGVQQNYDSYGYGMWMHLCNYTYSPITGFTWDDVGNFWTLQMNVSGTPEGYAQNDVVFMRWIAYTPGTGNYGPSGDPTMWTYDRGSIPYYGTPASYDGDKLLITSETGFDYDDNADLIGIEYVSTVDEIWVFEGGTDDLGAVHRYTAEIDTSYYLGSITQIYSSPIDLNTYHVHHMYLSWDYTCNVAGADITIDRQAAGADICRILMFANLAEGGSEIRKYSNGDFSTSWIASDQFQAAAVNNDAVKDTHNLTLLGSGSSNAFYLYYPPSTW
jgi:hypothetical protein